MMTTSTTMKAVAAVTSTKLRLGSKKGASAPFLLSVIRLSVMGRWRFVCLIGDFSGLQFLQLFHHQAELGLEASGFGALGGNFLIQLLYGVVLKGQWVVILLVGI